MVSSEADQVTDGHWWIKQVRSIAVVDALADWTLHLDGARDEDLDRATFESGAAQGCHGAAWTDDRANVWNGIPLWLLVGRMDDDNVHDAGAFNRELASFGYRVTVTSKSGSTVVFESARVAENNDILLAYRLNDVPLDGGDFPLRLVGNDLTQAEMLGGVTGISLEFPAAEKLGR